MRLGWLVVALLSPVLFFVTVEALVMIGPGSLIFLILGGVVFVALSVQEGNHKRHVESPIQTDPEPVWVALRPFGLDGLGLIAAITLFVLAAHFLVALGGGHR